MAYEIIASTGALAALAGLAPNPPTMLAIIDLAHGTRQLAGYACVHVDTCAKRGWIERRPSVRTCIISAVMTSTGPLVELTSPRRVPWSARWRGRTAVAPPPLPVRPRPPYYWFAENQEEQPSAFTTLPTPPIPRDTHFYPRDPAQTSRDPRDPTDRHPRLDTPHRPPASSSDLHSSIHNHSSSHSPRHPAQTARRAHFATSLASSRIRSE
jgi:hypothetical protein